MSLSTEDNKSKGLLQRGYGYRYRSGIEIDMEIDSDMSLKSKCLHIGVSGQGRNQA